MVKKISNQVQEVHRVPYRINPRRNMPGHILIKLSKIKYKETILKAAREKQQKTYNQDYSTQQRSHLNSVEKLKLLQTSKS